MAQAVRVPVSLRESCSNVFGRLDPAVLERIDRYLADPTPDGWDDIQSIIVSGANFRTIWQAVVLVDPTFPRTGRATDADGRTVRDWTRVPHPFLVLRGIQAAVASAPRSAP